MLGQNSREAAHIPARSAGARSAESRRRSKRWALPIRIRPPLFFCLAKRKAAAAAVEKKSAGSKLAAERKLGEYGSQLFCSETCLSLRGTGGVRRVSSPVRRDDQTANLWVRKGHPQFLFPRSPRCSALPVPRMSASGSGTRSRGRPLCSPVNAALPNAGAQFRKERLSAQPVKSFWTLSAVRIGRSPAPEGFPKGRAAARPFVPRGVWGKRAKRRLWRIKRPAFEETARLAARQGRESYCRDGVRWRPHVSL